MSRTRIPPAIVAALTRLAMFETVGAFPALTKPATFNRSRIMQAAHTTAKWRVAASPAARGALEPCSSRTEYWSADWLLHCRHACPHTHPYHRTRPSSCVARPSQTQCEFPHALHAEIWSPRRELRGVIVKLAEEHDYERNGRRPCAGHRMSALIRVIRYLPLSGNLNARGSSLGITKGWTKPSPMSQAPF